MARAHTASITRHHDPHNNPSQALAGPGNGCYTVSSALGDTCNNIAISPERVRHSTPRWPPFPGPRPPRAAPHLSPMLRHLPAPSPEESSWPRTK
ncbi:hypothetical protein Scinn_33210 [Streptomyces virginiae]|uniref:DUF397 domain-containing protein n=1 Tax=Streptomyces virginiae TaxID=1961 RepID=A0ABQ3NM56_STRVG|nr:hypothetical protein Scinn_33210 [Streptomyces virginiae]